MNVVELLRVWPTFLDLSANESRMECQNVLCRDKAPAVRVCRHPNCMEKNDERPYLLCTSCDHDIHSSSENSGHLVFDLKPGQRKSAPSGMSNGVPSPLPGGGDDSFHSRQSSTVSLTTSEGPSETQSSAASETEVDDGDRMRELTLDDPDGLYLKKVELDSKGNSSVRASKFRRKKAVKGRRHHTDLTLVTRRRSDVTLSTLMCSPGDSKRRHSMVNINDELITVHIPIEEGKPAQTEVIAAIRNSTLREAIFPLLERRRVDLTRVNVFLDSSHTALPWNCELFLLGGKNLHIKDKEGESILARTKSVGGIKAPTMRENNNWPFNKPTGSNTRSRRVNNPLAEDGTPSLVPATSPHGSWSSVEKKTPRTQTRLQLLFNPPNKDKEKQEQLTEILNSYSVDGLPSLPDLMRIPGQPVYTEDLFALDAHWSSLVANASSLTKRQHDQQEAIWELLHTEVDYIRSLKVITDLFTCVLLNLQQEVLLNEIETEKLFSNINEIYLSNCEFWKNHFVKVLENSRETRKPLDPCFLRDGFKKFGENFKPYTKYCLEQKPCLDYMKARYRDNDLFKSFVVWAEAQKQCNRLKLTDLLVKPMQRLTKYSLLLQAVLRKTEDDKQRRAILEMIGNVDRFVSHVNGELRKRHEQERLGAIIGKIESYDAVEAPNEECKETVQQYSELNLWDPMPGCDASQPRCVIIQSGLKLKDAQTRVDVECMLFTDMLLLCKASKRMDKFKVIKPPMRVDKIVVQELKDRGSFLLLYLNEYRVPVSAYTMHSDPASVRVWLEHIRKAQDLYNEAKMASVRIRGEAAHAAEISSNSPNSPSSFLGESLDSASFVSALGAEPPPPSAPPPIRPRAYTVGSEDPADTDEVSEYSATSLKRDELLKGENKPGVEVFSPGNSVIERLSETPPQPAGKSDNKSKLMQQSMSLPLSSPHPNDSSESASQSGTDDEAAKLKLNQRRTSRTERRYHTADSIRELERRDQDRDNSIHKRLSWNLGMVDISLDEKRGSLKQKAFSSDSIRSVPSSSGVSSTGSLHLSPESEISEESETNSVKASPALNRSLNDGPDSPMNLSTDVPEVHSEQNLNSAENNLSPEDKYSKSKSTSDIANLMSDLTTSSLKDGISSVELPRIGAKTKKLSYSQMLAVKKQLLLNSDLEASEV